MPYTKETLVRFQKEQAQGKTMTSTRNDQYCHNAKHCTRDKELNCNDLCVWHVYSLHCICGWEGNISQLNLTDKCPDCLVGLSKMKRGEP